MVAIGKTFRTGDYNTEQRGSTVPNGIYRLEVESADVKKNAKNTGKIFSAEIVVIEPEKFKGRKIFFNANIEHDNPKAQEIGEEDFARLAKACGIGEDEEVEDTDQLVQQPFMARVGEEKDSSPPKNKIFRFFYPDDDQPEASIDPVKDTPNRGGSSRGNDRGNDRSASSGRGREEQRGGRDEGRSRDDRGAREDKGREDKGRDSDRGRSEDRGSRDRDERGRGDEDDNRGRDDDRGEDRSGGDEGSSRGGAGGRPWDKGRR